MNASVIPTAHRYQKNGCFLCLLSLKVFQKEGSRSAPLQHHLVETLGEKRLTSANLPDALFATVEFGKEKFTTCFL